MAQMAAPAQELFDGGVCCRCRVVRHSVFPEPDGFGSPLSDVHDELSLDYDAIRVCADDKRLEHLINFVLERYASDDFVADFPPEISIP